MEGKTLNKVLQAWIEDAPSVRIVRLRREVDLTSASVLQQYLTRLIGDGRPIVVDFSQLRYLDMSGVRVPEEAHRKGSPLGQQIVFVGSPPHRPQVARHRIGEPAHPSGRHHRKGARVPAAERTALA